MSAPASSPASPHRVGTGLTSGAAPASLSVVLPTYNEAAWLGDTLTALRIAVAESDWPDVEILVVDDGSTDTTKEVLDRYTEGSPYVRVLPQPNLGRLAARRRGLEEATGRLVLFVDSRVHVHQGSLRFLRAELERHPERAIWNGHAVTASTNQPWTRFWDAIAFLAWRRYLQNPRTTSYGVEDFDWYPKGTTCFLAPRQWLIDASDAVESLSDDPKLANDDTLMIRNLLRFGRINISPEFSCTYHPRQSLQAFMRNAYHRGSVLVDGHLRPGLRFYRPFVALAAVAPFVAVAALRRPKRALALFAAANLGVATAARAAGVPTADAVSFGALLAPFSAAYGAGIVRGFGVRRRR